MSQVRWPIYLDYHSTTPVDPRVAAVVLRFMTEDFGNAASADHTFGDAAEEAVETAASHVASLIGAQPSEVFFTSGATESVHLGICGLALHPRRQRRIKIGLTGIEHSAVLNICRGLQEFGKADLVSLRIDSTGSIDLSEFESKCKAGLDLVCVMTANNEVGTIQPLIDITSIAHKWGAMVFTDATQAAGQIAVSFRDWDVDLMAVSAHKMYGPKGVGALLKAPHVRLQSLFQGSSQPRTLRDGTLNVPGIAGFGEAANLRLREMDMDAERIRDLRDQLQNLIMAALHDVHVHGHLVNRLPGNLCFAAVGAPNKAVVARLRQDVALSTGAACSSGLEQPSHVLRALGLDSARMESTLRAGVGKFTTQEEIDAAGGIIIQAIRDVRSIISR